jgi:hypothetical protein
MEALLILFAVVVVVLTVGGLRVAKHRGDLTLGGGAQYETLKGMSGKGESGGSALG